MDNLNTKQKILALLFYEGAVQKSSLDKILPEWRKVLPELQEYLSELGVLIVDGESYLKLALDSDLNEFINKTHGKKDANFELSDSASQVLTMILHCSPVSKFEIDFVRGVNSANTLKRLELAGLVTKKKEKNKNVYYPSAQVLADMGIKDYEKFKSESEFCKNLQELLSLEDDKHESSGHERDNS